MFDKEISSAKIFNKEIRANYINSRKYLIIKIN